MELGCKGPESFADCWKRGWNNKVNWCIHNSLTADVSIGDYVLIHTGFAIEKIDEKEAIETLDLLRKMAEAI